MYGMSGEKPIYMLTRAVGTGFTAYVPGISVFNIHLLEECRLMRFYPEPAKDITKGLIRFQNLYRERLRYRRWCSHPLRLRHRQMTGRWPLSFCRR